MINRFLFLMVLMSTACLAQPPQWALTHKNPNFPVEAYILGVGSAKGENADDAAKRLAQSDVASQVRVRVQTEIKNIQQTYELNNDERTFAEFRIKSTSVVDEELPGAQIIETQTDPATNTTYALAVLNKLQFARTIESELTRGWSQVSELVTTSSEFFRHGKITEALQSLADARQTAIGLLPKVALHDAVSPISYETMPSLGPAALASKIRNFISCIRVEKKDGDAQKGKIGDPFSRPFIVAVSVSVDSVEVLAAGVGVEFLSSTGELLGATTTDATGMAKFSTTVRATIGSSIRAQIALRSLAGEFDSNLAAKSTQFTYSTVDADVAFSVRIEVIPVSISNILSAALTDAVTKIGYQVVDMSRFEIVGSLRTSPASAITGLGGTIYNISCEATIYLQDKETGRTLGTIVIKSSGVGSTEEEAKEKAAHITIDSSELFDLLEKAKV